MAESQHCATLRHCRGHVNGKVLVWWKRISWDVEDGVESAQVECLAEVVGVVDRTAGPVAAVGARLQRQHDGDLDGARQCVLKGNEHTFKYRKTYDVQDE